MIIKCEKCGTKYRFDESLIVGDGVRVRCTRCGYVFFQENPSRKSVATPIDIEERETLDFDIQKEAPEEEIVKGIPDFDDFLEEKEPAHTEMEEKTGDELEKEFPGFDDFLEDREFVDTVTEEKIEEELERETPGFDDFPEEKEFADTITEERIEDELKREAPDLDDSLGGESFDIVAEDKIKEELEGEAPDLDDSLEEEKPVDTETEGAKKTEKKKKSLWTPEKVFVYIVIVILVMGVVYMLLFPQIRKQVLNNISHYITTFSQEKKNTVTPVLEGNVDFTKVKERLIKNFILGDLLVIQGTVVNKYEHPISKVKVRGKILNAAKDVLNEVEFYCGNLLTDEELGHLTKEEIAEELSIEMGSDISNNNIAPQGEIPFMIVFINPPEEAVEFIVELAKDSSSYK